MGVGEGVGLPIMPPGVLAPAIGTKESGGEHHDREGRDHCLELACHALTIPGLGCGRCVA